MTVGIATLELRETCAESKEAKEEIKVTKEPGISGSEGLR
jgi:hypothetical protein